MIISTTCALLLVAVSSADVLDQARAAFARTEYARAERLALQAAKPPTVGAALYLAGLARFRDGRPKEALQALDDAGHAADPPPKGPWRYNRASCLYELGRHAEAEEEFAVAASLDPSLAVVALVNAGHAAMEQQAPTRARSYAGQARALARGPSRELVAELQARIATATGAQATSEYREGLAAYDAGRYTEAREHFHRAAEISPSDGRARLMAGAAALELDERDEALVDLRRAMEAGLSEKEAAIARDYLALASRDPSGEATLVAKLRIEAGWDSDTLQSGPLTGWTMPGVGFVDSIGSILSHLGSIDPRNPATWPDIGSPPVAKSSPSTFMTVDGNAGGRFRVRNDLSAELTYGLGQIAFLAGGVTDRSLQQHLLMGALEWSPNDRLHLGGALIGQVVFTGFSDFRGLQAGAGGRGWGVFEESVKTRSRLAVGWTRKIGLSSEFGYLTGNRGEAGFLQEIGPKDGTWTTAVGYQLALEDIGTTSTTVTSLGCLAGCTLVEPLGYVGHTLWASARVRFAGRLETELSTGIERRDYLADIRIDRADEFPGPPFPAKRREDLRWFGIGQFSWELSKGFVLLARLEIVANSSNLGDETVGISSFTGDRSYKRQVVSLGARLVW